MSVNTICQHCGHRYADHNRILVVPATVDMPAVYDGGGACACGECASFIAPHPHIKFRKLLKWARKWHKTSTRRTPSKLRQIWKGLNKEIEYLTYCRVCKASTVSNNDVSKHLLHRYEGLQCKCSRCIKCCECIQCLQCKRRVQPGYVCQDCNSCINGCCPCYKCDRCLNKCGGDTCGSCSVCNTCCECSDQYRVPFIKQQPKFHKPDRAQHKINPTSRFIAAEIEVAEISGRGKAVYREVKRWGGSVVYDGSLPRSGFEINTAPAGGDLFIDQVKAICAKLSNVDAYINEKCGLHVHLDARDFNYYDIRRLIKVYANIEPALFSMVPYNRYGSRFCLPCGDKLEKAIAAGRLPYEKVKSDIIAMTYNNSKSTLERRSNKYEKARYNALNIHSWFYRGTIECRMFEGSINTNDITNWGIMWATILDYVLKTSDEDVLHNMEPLKPMPNLIKTIGSNAALLRFIDERIKLCKTHNLPQWTIPPADP